MARKKTTTPKKGTRSKPRASGNRMSALDAAAKVMAKEAESLSARQLIERMTQKGYWTSPAGPAPVFLASSPRES